MSSLCMSCKGVSYGDTVQASKIPRHVLDLDGETIEVGNGYWVVMRIKEIEADSGRPHGIQYALTFHAPGGKRLIGYDNAHTPAPTQRGPARRSRQPSAFDHIHHGDRIKAYHFTTAENLLEDFWHDVETFLNAEGIS